LLTPDTIVAPPRPRGRACGRRSPIRWVRAGQRTGTAAVLEASRPRGVSRIAFGSSSSIYGDSTPSPFRGTPRRSEPVCVRRHQAGGRAPRPRCRADLRISFAPSCGFFTSTGRGSGPTSPSSVRAPHDRGRGDHPVRRRPQARDLHLLRRTSVAGVTAAIDWTARAPIGWSRSTSAATARAHRRDGGRAGGRRSASSRNCSGTDAARATSSGRPRT